jgi:pimeloyl-ACP methyl ester carboxylesterase
MTTIRTWVRRIALGLVGLLALATVVGAGYELAGRRRAAREFPPPGRLVDVGGRLVHLDCRGAGAPVVVFEAGLDVGGALDWSSVHDSVATTTRACAYSRAGIMWSDPRPGPQSGKTVAEDLHATLARAGERPPFVLVAHSLGGPYAMTYTKHFGADVAGLVFVDASHPDQVRRLASVTSESSGRVTRPYKVASALAWTGLVRALAGAMGGVPHEPAAATRATAAYAATSLRAMLKEADAIDETLAEAGTVRQLGARPLMVLTAAAPLSPADLAGMKLTPAQGRQRAAIWRALQADEASWSSRGQHRLVPDAHHYIQFDRPDVVIAAVRAVIDSVRHGVRR